VAAAGSPSAYPTYFHPTTSHDMCDYLQCRDVMRSAAAVQYGHTTYDPMGSVSHAGAQQYHDNSFQTAAAAAAAAGARGTRHNSESTIAAVAAESGGRGRYGMDTGRGPSVAAYNVGNSIQSTDGSLRAQAASQPGAQPNTPQGQQVYSAARSSMHSAPGPQPFPNGVESSRPSPDATIVQPQDAPQANYMPQVHSWLGSDPSCSLMHTAADPSFAAHPTPEHTAMMFHRAGPAPFAVPYGVTNPAASATAAAVASGWYQVGNGGAEKATYSSMNSPNHANFSAGSGHLGPSSQHRPHAGGAIGLYPSSGSATATVIAQQAALADAASVRNRNDGANMAEVVGGGGGGTATNGFGDSGASPIAPGAGSVASGGATAHRHHHHHHHHHQRQARTNGMDTAQQEQDENELDQQRNNTQIAGSMGAGGKLFARSKTPVECVPGAGNASAQRRERERSVTVSKVVGLTNARNVLRKDDHVVNLGRDDDRIAHEKASSEEPTGSDSGDGTGSGGDGDGSGGDGTASGDGIGSGSGDGTGSGSGSGDAMGGSGDGSGSASGSGDRSNTEETEPSTDGAGAAVVAQDIGAGGGVVVNKGDKRRSASNIESLMSSHVSQKRKAGLGGTSGTVLLDRAKGGDGNVGAGAGGGGDGAQSNNNNIKLTSNTKRQKLEVPPQHHHHRHHHHHIHAQKVSADQFARPAASNVVGAANSVTRPADASSLPPPKWQPLGDRNTNGETEATDQSSGRGEEPNTFETVRLCRSLDMLMFSVDRNLKVTAVIGPSKVSPYPGAPVKIGSNLREVVVSWLSAGLAPGETLDQKRVDAELEPYRAAETWKRHERFFEDQGRCFMQVVRPMNGDDGASGGASGNGTNSAGGGGTCSVVVGVDVSNVSVMSGIASKQPLVGKQNCATTREKEQLVSGSEFTREPERNGTKAPGQDRVAVPSNRSA